VSRDQLAAGGAFVFPDLVFNELIQPVSFDFLQIIDHAQAVPEPVFVIEAFEARAGEALAFEAKFDFPFQDLAIVRTLFHDERTLFFSRAAARAMGDFPADFRQIVFVRQIGAAHRAIHPARGDEPAVDRIHFSTSSLDPNLAQLRIPRPVVKGISGLSGSGRG